jgi:hypothetical protein
MRRLLGHRHPARPGSADSGRNPTADGGRAGTPDRSTIGSCRPGPETGGEPPGPCQTGRCRLLWVPCRDGPGDIGRAGRLSGDPTGAGFRIRRQGMRGCAMPCTTGTHQERTSDCQRRIERDHRHRRPGVVFHQTLARTADQSGRARSAWRQAGKTASPCSDNLPVQGRCRLVRSPPIP